MWSWGLGVDRLVGLGLGLVGGLGLGVDRLVGLGLGVGGFGVGGWLVRELGLIGFGVLGFCHFCVSDWHLRFHRRSRRCTPKSSFCRAPKKTKQKTKSGHQQARQEVKEF